jgi:hypothetical protein
MSIEAGVDEMYGESKDEGWKKKEVSRIKQENGIAEIDETYEIDDYTPIEGFS